MKSFAFGAAAALIAAYTVADTPEGAGSVDPTLTASSLHDFPVGGVASESPRRSQRGLPPFWGHKGLSEF